LFITATILIFGQLLLGATMRHQHAGLAIPDFPLAYGRLWPATDPASVAHYNQQRMEVAAANPITAFQIRLQMVHRLVAVLILAAVAACAWLTRRGAAFAWLGLILAQAVLGMATLWSNKAADIATAHVVVGALSLALGASLSIVCCRGWPFPHTLETPRVAGEALPRTPFGARRAAVTGLE
jgi:cytochrome c oxidase assembly protein subunit 15